MFAGYWVASTKPESVIVCGKAGCLVKNEGGLWRRVIAGQEPVNVAGHSASPRNPS